ncbi:hypothetical protein PRUPE_1G188900 [Prunus persica]|uniref:CCHC-type domain-containing protein n=1 Tax=Prunus persica TaxID=3760 RepID=A0A251QZQ9_PRUPE|nr:hypothetical protein PRUPE_1G188900 [Prunus persica]
MSIPSQFKVEQFDGNMSFTIWQRIVKGKDAKQERMVVIREKTWSRDEDSARTLWEKLERLYLNKSLNTKLNLKQDLYKLKMNEGLLNQLARVDVKIKEENKTFLLLTSLPNLYDRVLTTMFYDKYTLKMEDVEATLLSNEKRKIVEDSHSQNQKGRQTVRGSSSHNKSKSRDSGKGVQCYKCKELGHLK